MAPGAKLSKPPTCTSLTPEPPPHTRQGATALLMVVGGPDEGRCAMVSARAIVVGSAPDADLVLTDPTVSRRHLRASWNGSTLHLSDLDSKNGSYFEGERFHKLSLSLGVELVVGKTVLKAIPNEEVVDAQMSAEPWLGSLAGGSPTMRKLFSLIVQVAETDATVILEGETGVGKELVAEEIHRRSRRADKPLRVFDCGAVPDELIESALFGHVRGAFTGADAERAGVFAEADGGTVFLDEIGELGIAQQPALLRVLDRGTIRPVGAARYQPVDVRVVAATHRNLAARIADGAFREDLYYRLAVVRLSIPALRERAEDIPLLVRHFLGKLGRPDLEIDDSLMERLMEHPWPGNVRELRNAIERGAALAIDGKLDPDIVLPPPMPAAPHRASSQPETPEARPRAGLRSPEGGLDPFREAKAAAIEAFEREYLTELMSSYDSVTAAAAAAGMDRKHLRMLLGRYAIARARTAPGDQ